MIEVVRRQNSLDMVLYDFAGRLFAQRYEEHGPSARELRAFRRQNWVFDMLQRLQPNRQLVGLWKS